MSADKSLREAVRQNLGNWLKKLDCGGDVEKQLAFKKRLIAKLKSSPVIAIETTTANQQHYEVPTEFYKACLGKRLKYSSCFWPPGTQTLEQAEDAGLKQICERAQLQDGQRVLDLGCGWGSLGLYICEKFPNCQVTCVSNSRTQREHIQREAEKRGFGRRLQAITCDANVYNTETRFDRVISIEMMEHMKNLEKLLERVASWLKPDGLLLTQILCHRSFPYEFDVRKGSDTEWMARNFFSGGTMQSADLFLYFQKDLQVIDQWIMNGKHYTKTLEAWLERLDQNIDTVKSILKETYDSEADQNLFNWRMFFMFTAEVFGYKDGNEWLLAFHLFRKRPVQSML
ncbi:(S)-coclaurine N-methyltransferase [Lingula anatina]|uniref:(S)-coclaurine N-methyltransferase n=1 Tax=Lingula anatina TaxID=7574 RepID=A0A1S3IG97_LINAN|nr:(S)-coclaurine N-methyltransferase [Lingula anatina]|eukprot:XP_013397285.1 (S)-coclaurine N-methyltransferase [Lingula anatina]